MPAPPSSLIDPAIGHLVELAGDATEEQPGLLGVLAQVADPRHRRGVRYRLAVILGLALCAVVAGARSFTAIAEWAADADEQTLRLLGVTGVVPSESTFRRALQRLDADAFDDLAGSGRSRPPCRGRSGGSSRWTARLYGARPAAGNPAIICWLPLTTGPWRRLGPGRSGSEDERDPDVRHAAGPRWPGRERSSPPMRCTPSAATPATWPASAARTTCSPSSATSLGLFAELAALLVRGPCSRSSRERYGRRGADPRSHCRGRWAGLPPPAQPSRSCACAAQCKKEMVPRDCLRDRLRRPSPRRACWARRHHPRPLGRSSYAWTWVWRTWTTTRTCRGPHRQRRRVMANLAGARHHHGWPATPAPPPPPPPRRPTRRCHYERS